MNGGVVDFYRIVLMEGKKIFVNNYSENLVAGQELIEVYFSTYDPVIKYYAKPRMIRLFR